MTNVGRKYMIRRDPDELMFAIVYMKKPRGGFNRMSVHEAAAAEKQVVSMAIGGGRVAHEQAFAPPVATNKGLQAYPGHELHLVYPAGNRMLIERIYEVDFAGTTFLYILVVDGVGVSARAGAGARFLDSFRIHLADGDPRPGVPAQAPPVPRPPVRRRVIQ